MPSLCACSYNRAVYTLVMVIILCVVTSAFTVPFLIADNSKQRSNHKDEVQFLIWAKSAFSDELYRIRPVIHGVVGNIYGKPLLVTSYNASVEERIRDQNFPTFEIAAANFGGAFVRTGFLFVAPGGVITQTYPESPPWSLVDLLDAEYSFRFLPFYDPSDLHFQTNIVYHTKEWKILEVLSVYSTTDRSSPFWGVAGAVLPLEQVQDRLGFIQAAENAGLLFLVAIQSPENHIIPIISSEGFDQQTPQEELLEFIVQSQKAEMLQGGLSVLVLFVKLKREVVLKHLSVPWLLCIVLSVATTICAVVLSIIIGVARHTENYQSPKSPPFAMMIIGQKAEDMWSFATEELTATLEKHVRRHRACQIPPLQPNTHTFILRSVDDAVKMGLNVLREVRQEFSDVHLALLMGEEAPAIITCAVHWCTEAEAIVNPAEEYIRYKGADITYCTKLYDNALGNAVMLSSRAKERTTCISQSDINLHLSLADRSAGVDETHFVFENDNLMRNMFFYAQQISHHEIRRSSLESGASTGSEERCQEIPTNTVADPLFDTREETERRCSPKESFEKYLKSRMPNPPTRSARRRREPNLFFNFLSNGRLNQPNHTEDAANQFHEINRFYERRVAPDIDEEYCSVDRAFLSNFNGAAKRKVLPQNERCISSSITIDPSTIPAWLDRALQKTYERHPLSFGPNKWPCLNFVIYVFYFGYALLFQPLAPRERENITRCLATAFGVARQGLYEYLAVHCAIAFTYSKLNTIKHSSTRAPPCVSQKGSILKHD